MAEKDTSGWGLYDWLDVADYNRWERRCPECGETDVKFALHDKATVGCELSVCCNDCGQWAAGNNSGDDVERMVREWHEQPNSMLSGATEKQTTE